MKISQYLLIIVLVLSVFGNMFLLFGLTVSNMAWEHEYNQSNYAWEYAYTQNTIQWCENENDWIDYSNELILQLRFYNSTYDDIKYTDNTNCWIYDN